MVQDAGVRVRTKAPCLFRDTRPRAAGEYPVHSHFPLSACLFEDTTVALLGQLACNGSHTQKRNGLGSTTIVPGLTMARNVQYYLQVEGNKNTWGRQRAVSTVRYYVVPPPCLLSRSRMTVRRSSNAYTGSAAVGEPTPPNRRHADPSKIINGKMRRED